MRKSKMKNRLLVILVERLAGRLVTMVAPWIIALVVCPVFSIIFYFLWSDYTLWVSVGFVTTGTLLALLAHKLSHDRRFMGRWHGTISVIACFGWLWSATLNGPFSRPTFDIGFAMGLFLSLSWTLRGAIRSTSSGESNGLVNWPQASEDVGLPGSTWRTLPSSNSKKLSGVIKTAPGKQSFDDVKSRKGLLATLFDAPASGVRITKTDKHSEARVDIVREDFLKHEIKWPHPQFLGDSVADGPIKIGHYEDEETALLDLYSPHGARHLMVSGMNGSGKSVAARVILADLFSRRDVSVWAIDVVKGRQTLQCAEIGLDMFVTSRNEANILMASLTSVITKRADFLGMHGYDAWTPEAFEKFGMKFLVVLIEEAPAIVRDADTFVRIVEQARSAGVSIIASIQRASYSNMPTDARAQLGTVLCFGVRDVQDARFALSNDMVERGADPSVWQQSRPGYAYLQSPDINEERQIVPLRVYNITKEEVSEMAKHSPKTIDTITTDALEGKLTGSIAQPSTAGVSRMSPDRAKEELDKYLEEYEDFTPKDLYPLLEKVGRKRPWLHTELNRRIDEGELIQSGSTYTKISNEESVN